MPEKSRPICLYHATPVNNLDSILKQGLLPGRKTGKSNASWRDARAVYLGKKDGLNYPSHLLELKTALFKICIPREKRLMLLADDDWARNKNVDNGEISEDEWEEMDIDDRDDFAIDCKSAVKDGFGARYIGSIPPEWIKNYEIGSFKKGIFVKDTKCVEDNS